jgi:hypothetical protein
LRRHVKRLVLSCSRAFTALLLVMHPSQPERVIPGRLRIVSTGGDSSLVAAWVLRQELP